MSISRARRSASLSLLSALVAGACIDFSGVDAVAEAIGGRLASVSVFPSAGALVEVGDTVRLSAVGRPSGIAAFLQYDPIPDAVWTVSDASVARLEPLGPPPRDSLQQAQTLVRGVRPGTVTTSATARGVAGGANVRVIPVIQRIALRPARDTVRMGDTVVVFAVARDAAGDSVGQVPLEYEATGGARVLYHYDGHAFVLATLPGPATVVARFRRASGTTTLTVIPRVP